MSWLYRGLIRPVLFWQDAEKIHTRTLHALAWASGHVLACDALEAFFGPPPLPIKLFGLQFPNPVGLAAGMDKAAEAVPAWAALGFGHCEVGAVTAEPQLGNAEPRLFRAISEGAIVNRMGFNNPGAAVVAAKLMAWRKVRHWPGFPVGVNLGKTKTVPLAEAAEDYAKSFRLLAPRADFFVVNVSSPNTPNLRELQDKSALDEILAAIQAQDPKATKPLLVKVAPDLSFEALDELVGVVLKRNLAGIVATNTTVSRPETGNAGVKGVYDEAGGLSGRPLRERSTEVIRHLYRQTEGKLPIIGVGGIFNAADAWEKITAGASLVQVYTGLVYEGPGIARSIVTGLRERMAREGMRNIHEAVGSAARP